MILRFFRVSKRMSPRRNDALLNTRLIANVEFDVDLPGVF